MTTMAETPRRTTPSLVGPTILVGLGVILLLNNLGLLSWSVWDTLFRLWPILLIAAGLDLMIGRRSLALSGLISVAMVLAIGVAIWFAGAWAPRGVPLPTNTINQGLDGATQAEVELRLGVGELRLSAMEAAEGLISGRVYSERNIGVTQRFDTRDGTAFFVLQQESGPQIAPWSGRGANERWDLQLTPGVPLRLTLDTGAGVTRANLRDLRISELIVNSGVGQIDVTLPERGQFNGRINGGIGETIVTLPSGVAARLTIQRGLGSVTTPANFIQRGDVYESPGYAEAANRVDLTINGGIGSIEVRMER